MTIEKLNKTFNSKQVLESADMNKISAKIDEIITSVNSHEEALGEYTELIDQLNGEVV